MDYDADSDEEETEEAEEKTNGIPDSSNDEVKPSGLTPEEPVSAAASEPMESETTEEEESTESESAEVEKAPVEKTEAEVDTTTKSPIVVEATPTVTPSEEGDEPAAKRPRTEDH